MRAQLSERMIDFYSRRPMLAAFLAATLSLAIIFGIDSAVGDKSAFRALYILPIWIATRLGGRGVGLLVVILTTALNSMTELGNEPDLNAQMIVSDVLLRFGSLGAIMLLISQVEETLAQYQLYARHDPLTGLLNRRALTEFAEPALQRARRAKQPFAVAVVDCDEFKQVNDQHGHQVGDRVLQLVAHTLEAYIRNTDLVARTGGDEFIIVLQGNDETEVRAVLKRIQKVFAEMMEREGLVTSLSVGVAHLHEGVRNLDELIHRADNAMYANKQRKKTSLYLT